MILFGRTLATIVAVTTFIGGVTPAFACTAFSAPHVASAQTADLVFIGKFKESRIFGWESWLSGVSMPYGQYTFSVSETLKGKSQPEWKIISWISLAGTEVDIDPAKTVIVAAANGGATAQILVEAGLLSDQQQGVAYINRVPLCASAPIFENNPGNRAAIEAMLAPTDEVAQ